MPSERGASLLIAAAFTWLLGRFLGVPELYVVAAAAAVLVLLSVATVWVNHARIDIEHSLHPARIAWGDVAHVTMQVKNRSVLPTGMLLISDDVPHQLADHPRFAVPSLRRGGELTLTYEVAGMARGRYRLGPSRVRLRDPFGLSERVQRAGGADDVVVYPRVEALGSGVPLAPRPGESGSHRRALLHAGDEFSSIREWAPGDDIRLVHWASTARRNRLMVRQFEQPSEPLATLFCDTRTQGQRGPGIFASIETAITATASVAHHLHRHGMRLRLALPDDNGVADTTSIDTVMERLAEVNSSNNPTLQSAMSSLRGRGAGGLFIAALPAPGRTVVNDPDVAALLSTGRSYSVRIALIVDPHAGNPERPAAALASVLRANGWRTAIVQPGAPLSDAWANVAGAVALIGGGA